MLSTFIMWIRLHVRSERGQDLIEYALLSGIIAAALIVSVVVFEDAITAMGDGIADCVDFDTLTPCGLG